MKDKCPRLLALALVLVAMAAIACADTVVVSPSSPGAWTWMHNRGNAQAYFTKGGPAPAEGNPFPTGNGAFYAQLTAGGGGSWNDTPDSAWLGTDMHNNQSLAGIKLRQLTKLQYSAYVSGCWSLNFDQRIFPAEPFALTLTVRKPVEGAEIRRQFWYRPWGLNGEPVNNDRRQWMTYDCINMTSSPETVASPVWYEFNCDNGAPPASYRWTSWNDLINTVSGGVAYGDWELVPTSTYYDTTGDTSGDIVDKDPLGWKSAGWGTYSEPPGTPKATGTGTCLNLWVGARKATVTREQDLGQGNSVSWYGESTRFRGYVDNFTLGVNYGTQESPNVVETTYDFASDDPAPQVVATTIASRWVPTPSGTPYPYAKYSPALYNQDRFLYRFFGIVQGNPAPGQDPNNGEYYFYIWDFSYMTSAGATMPATIQVRFPKDVDPDLYPGDYVSVLGYLYDKFYDKTEPPTELTSSPGNVVLYNY